MALSFPGTSTPVKSNSHPYAIKTTSTGILTRSNSTTSSNSSSHHFVPSSPSKHKSTHSHDSASSSSARPLGHRYSRSLTSNELPRPLPIPPNLPLSSSPMASPTIPHFDPHFNQGVPLMSPVDRRADDPLPGSVSQPDLTGVGGGRGGGASADDLPADPRIWSPSQLSTYLTSSSLRVTAGDVSPLVAQDIAAFVRTQKINGRKFLRLTEGDLDRYGLNQRWQSALLAASRCLRQDSLRGRIWTSSSAYPSAEQDEDYGNYSSTSSMSSSGSVSELHRGRPGNQSGRVKGMVASFERHGPSSSSSRSVSPTKGSTAAAATGSSTLPSSGRRSISPVKIGDSNNNNISDFGSIRSRPRPQSDTFPSYSRPSFMSSNNNHNHNSVMLMTSPPPDDALGDEPKKAEQPRRLLPYPPLPPSSPPQPPPPPQFDPNLVSSFGPYVLSPHPQDAVVGGGPGTPFPPGVLPFSPQPTGAGIDNTSLTAISSSSPDDQSHIMMMMMSPTQPPPIYASSPQPQQQQPPFDVTTFDTYQHHLAEGSVRPLPLPPHPSQFYQPLISATNTTMQGYTGSDTTPNFIGDNNNGALLSYSAPVIQGVTASSSLSPHLQQPQHQQQRGPAAAVPVPHVQIEQAQAPVSFVPDSSSSSPPSSHHHQHQYQQQQQRLPPPSIYYPAYQPEQQQQQQPIIHAPQPRLGSAVAAATGRGSSPTKILEEKLEELLEPRRPRSRVFPGSKRSTPGLSPGSRPRSRVASMNLTTPTTASAGVAAGGGVEGVERLDGSGGGSEHQDNNNANTLNVNGMAGLGIGKSPSQHHHHTHPRTRVISLPRTLSHRLSGVEAWGESHRHIVAVPPPDDDNNDNIDEDDLEIIHHHHRDPSNEDEQVKELEGEEEVGIEALLEKDVPPLPPVMVIPEEEPESIPPTAAAAGGYGHGHGREASTGSVGTSATTASHSRAGSLREPKSAVITVVDQHRRSSARLLRKKESDSVLPTSPTGRGEGEEEESIEALLAKAAALGVGDGGSIGGGSMRKQKKRTPMNGAEAWEMIGNVDTVKHLDGAEAGAGESGSGGGLSRSIEDIFSPIPVPLNQPRLPSASASPSHAKTKLKPKDQQPPKPEEDNNTEKELEKSIGETRKMVEEIKCRLDKVEWWISDTERREYQQQQQANAEKTRTTPESGNVWPPAVVRRMMLSASRVPGMLGLSAWAGSSASTPSSSTSASSSTRARARNPTTLILRFAKLGLSLSTYTVLFGISFCVIVLRMLGKRPGAGAGAIFAGIRGRGGGMANGNGALAGR